MEGGLVKSQGVGSKVWAEIRLRWVLELPWRILARGSPKTNSERNREQTTKCERDSCVTNSNAARAHFLLCCHLFSLLFIRFEESEYFSFSHLPHPENSLKGYTHQLAPGGPPIATSPRTPKLHIFDREALCASAHSLCCYGISPSFCLLGFSLSTLVQTYHSITFNRVSPASSQSCSP
jgi:hypothetical protein